ncbi:MAG: glycosyltransferase family 9 protein [Bacteroidota bacterium]
MQKILLIRFSSIGDIVLTTPVIRCLHKQLGAEVHFITKKQYLPLLEANPYLSKIFTIEKNVSEVISDLRKEQYHLIVDLHKNLRSWQVRLALGRKTYSFDKLNFKKWLLVRFKLSRLPEIHIVDRYLKSVEKTGVQNDGEGLDYFFPKKRPWSKIDPQGEFGTDGSRYIAFAIGAAHQTKRLPESKIIEICKKINQPVILLGGKEEVEEGEKVAKSVGERIINLCGKLTLHESAAILDKAEKVVTHDTGMMHIAAALQKEIVVVWGNTVPAFGMSPYFGKNKSGKQISFEVVSLSCRPCSKIGFQKCPKGHFRCMKNQNAAAIATMANKAQFGKP